MLKLYSTNCPRCNVLEKKLQQAGKEFDKVTEFDVKDFVAKGFTSAPILDVDGELMEYTEAVKWLNKETN